MLLVRVLNSSFTPAVSKDNLFAGVHSHSHVLIFYPLAIICAVNSFFRRLWLCDSVEKCGLTSKLPLLEQDDILSSLPTWTTSVTPEVMVLILCSGSSAEMLLEVGVTEQSVHDFISSFPGCQSTFVLLGNCNLQKHGAPCITGWYYSKDGDTQLKQCVVTARVF